MPQYLVTMTLSKANPLISIGHLTNIVTQKMHPSLDALMDLRCATGKHQRIMREPGWTFG